jgi:hypothetical protein
LVVNDPRISTASALECSLRSNDISGILSTLEFRVAPLNGALALLSPWKGPTLTTFQISNDYMVEGAAFKFFVMCREILNERINLNISTPQAPIAPMKRNGTKSRRRCAKDGAFRGSLKRCELLD